MNLTPPPFLQNFLMPLLQSHPLAPSTSQLQATTDLPSFIKISLHILEIFITGIIQYVLFLVWLLLLSVITQSLICVVVCLFLVINGQCSMQYGCAVCCLWTNGLTVGLFSVITNKAAMNIHMQAFIECTLSSFLDKSPRMNGQVI